MPEGGRLEHTPVEIAEAIRVLTAEAAIAADDDATADIAALVGREPPALLWAGRLARTIGWRPLRDRLESWTRLAALVGASGLPWRADVERARASLGGAEAALLTTLAACDGPFPWDVLESVEPAASIASVCALEDAGLLARRTRAGVVTFSVPYGVRAVERLTDPAGAEARGVRWLTAWVARAEELRPTTYGVSSGATLSELAFAVPLAERALAAEAAPVRELGLALWTRVSDAMFFTAGAVEFGSPAFARAVALADAKGDVEPRVRARIVAGRATLERGDAASAGSLLAEAIALTEPAAGAALRSEALRGAGWAQLAAAELPAARASFVAAQALSEGAGDPRGMADAAAGRGILALLMGDPEAARSLLEDSVSTHVVTRDAPREAAVRAMMELLPAPGRAPADVGLLAVQLGELRASGQRWREALVLARLALAARARGDAAGEAARLREARAAAALSTMSARTIVASMLDATPAVSGGFVVGAAGRTLTLPSGEVHDLTRHGPLRRILWALAIAKERRSGAAMSTLELVEVGWPGEKMRHEAATLRVYTTIRRMRRLGLGDALVTRDDGYLIDPDVPIATEPEPAAG